MQDRGHLLTELRNPRSAGIDCMSIRVLVGPEVITGSTRLKAGTVTKLVLNMVTTLSMVRTGKVYENLMVDVNARAKRVSRKAGYPGAPLTTCTRCPAAWPRCSALAGRRSSPVCPTSAYHSRSRASAV